MISIGKRNLCAGGVLGGLNAKERIQRVGDSLDLFDLEAIDGAEVEDGTVCGTDLERVTESDKRWLKDR